MRPFETPEFSPSMKMEWIRATKLSFRSPKLLAKYHQEFNTITIPISSPESFFDDAVTAARFASSRADLEKELRKTGSLEHLLQFISGVVFGWESVEQELVKSDELSEDEDEAESCETQYFPDAFLHVPDAHEDSGLHLDDQDWRFNECSDHEEPQSKSVRTLLPNDGHGSSLSSPRAEKKGQEKRADEKQVAPISTTPTNLLQPRPGGTQPQPSSTHNMAARSLDIKQPVSSQNSALKAETPKSSHTTSQTPHAVSKMRGKGLANGSPQHSPNETTEEVVAKSHSHLKPSTNPPVTNKRRRAEDDNGEDTLVGERAHQRQKTLDGVSGQNYDLQHVP